jgi:hypothetical protein
MEKVVSSYVIEVNFFARIKEFFMLNRMELALLLIFAPSIISHPL